MGGLSRHPARRRRQLANLQQPPPAPLGNQRARRHGAYAQIAADRLSAKSRVIYDALGADAPLRDEDGGLPAADHGVVALLAECLARLDDVSAYVVMHGVLDEKGRVRPAAELEGRLRREANDYLQQLGMTPAARSRMGLDLARTATAGERLAAHVQDQHGGEGSS